MKLYNWLLKQIFYIRYLWLKQGNVKSYPFGNLAEFYSDDFEDGGWNKHLPWFAETKQRQDWNTYGIFKQKYGKFYFKVRLDGLVQGENKLQGTYVPAIWLLSIEENHYAEIDIELLKNDLSYTIWWNPNDKFQENIKHTQHSKFANHKFYRNLQKEYHLFLIDWSEKWIKFYVNGILSAKFRNEIHISLQVVISRCAMTKTIIQSNN